MTARADHTHEHVSYCMEHTIASARRFIPTELCVTCRTWWAGYKAALTPIPDEGDDDDSE